MPRSRAPRLCALLVAVLLTGCVGTVPRIMSRYCSEVTYIRDGYDVLIEAKCQLPPGSGASLMGGWGW